MRTSFLRQNVRGCGCGCSFLGLDLGGFFFWLVGPVYGFLVVDLFLVCFVLSAVRCFPLVAMVLGKFEIFLQYVVCCFHRWILFLMYLCLQFYISKTNSGSSSGLFCNTHPSPVFTSDALGRATSTRDQSGR